MSGPTLCQELADDGQPCLKLTVARDMCRSHYNRWYRRARPEEFVYRSGVRYSSFEMGMILDFGTPAAAVAEQIGRTATAVRQLRRRFNRGILRQSDWTDDQVDFIIDNHQAMTIPEMAEQLHRPLRQVEAEVARLVKNGALERARRNEVHHGSRLLLAKTCHCCGLLLAAEWFEYKRQDPSRSRRYRSTCKRCEAPRHKGKESSRRWHQFVQAYTNDRATRYGQEWTSEEFDVLSDPTKSILQKALDCGRTYSATSSALALRGLASKPEYLGDPRESAWRIWWEFAEADEAVAS